jgi:hypothetical protein
MRGTSLNVRSLGGGAPMLHRADRYAAVRYSMRDYKQRDPRGKVAGSACLPRADHDRASFR